MPGWRDARCGQTCSHPAAQRGAQDLDHGRRHGMMLHTADRERRRRTSDGRHRHRRNPIRSWPGRPGGAMCDRWGAAGPRPGPRRRCGVLSPLGVPHRSRARRPHKRSSAPVAEPTATNLEAGLESACCSRPRDTASGPLAESRFAYRGRRVAGSYSIGEGKLAA
jgi:hypothetical protein